MIIPYLWNPKESLRKESIKSWKALKVYYQISTKEETRSYLFSKTRTNKDGKLLKVRSYNEEGKEVSCIELVYPDENTEITIVSGGRHGETKDVKRFNEQGFLIEHVEESIFGGFDETKYHYDEKQRLVSIIKKEEDGEQTWENFIYKNEQLFKIETTNSEGESLFRGFIYNEKGIKEKMIRMQNGLVNLEVEYIYNSQGQLFREIHESVNRIKGGKNTLMTTEYDYHENGKLKKEIFTGMDSYKGKTKFESEEHYDKDGLLINIKEIDYIEENEEVFTYEYEL